MPGHGEKQSRKQEDAIAALLSCRTMQDAAKQIGIDIRTLSKWLRQPAFERMYRAARRQVVESSIGRLQQATSEAVESLRRNLICGTPSAEVSAAKAILEQSIKAVELMDLVERVEMLEHRASENEIDVAA